MTENTGAFFIQRRTQPGPRVVRVPWVRRTVVPRALAVKTFILARSPSTITIAVGVMFTVSTLTGRGLEAQAVGANRNDSMLAYATTSLRPSLAAPGDSQALPPSMYTVHEGDTLLSVAYRFGSTVEAISLASNLSNPQLLKVGQKLTIPPARSTIETIDPGTSAADVAASFGVDPSVVTAYNGVAAPNQPIDRNVVVLPPGPANSNDSTKPLLASTTKPSAPAAAADGSYTVQPGDTILGIAKRLGVDPDQLVADNGLADSDHIKVGQTLWTKPAQDDDTMVHIASVGNAGPAKTVALNHPPAPTTYRVAPGDTVDGLADKFGLDKWTIVNNNDLASADQINVGDQLTILPVSGLMYTVQPGDTLADIAARYHVDLGPIIDFNYLGDADHIAVGMEIMLPGASPLPPPTPAAVPATPSVYVVAPGDTAYSIAKRFGIEPSDLVVANKLASADSLSVGQQLKIVPGAGGGASLASSSPSSPPSQKTVTRNLPMPSPVPSAAAVGPSTHGGSVSSIALDYKGYRYVWGGTTPSGFDCSGFVYYVYSKSGSPISRGMWGQYNAGAHPSRGDLQPGDIVFFQNTYMAGLSHDGIYIGGGQFIHASDERTGVTISSLSDPYWSAHWFGATRVN